jgi:hypothetical protein
VGAVQNPIRLGFLIVVMAAMALPRFSHAQESGQVTKAALTVSETRTHARHQPGTTAVSRHTPKSERAAKSEKHVRKSAATARVHAHVRKAAVPRSTFEDRTAHYFDPLSLTLAPDSRLDAASTQYNQVVGKFVPSDQGQVAATPDDPTAHEISSASIENLEQGHNNLTIVVPLFQILNKLSDQPAPPPTQP